MNSQIELDNIIEVIGRAKKIGIFTHVSPDGDAIGSSLALYLGLKNANKDVEVIVDDYSDCFKFLSSVGDIKKKGSKDYDLAIALDCAAKGRLFDKNGSFDSSMITVAIDHHVSNTFFANYNYVEGNNPATCMILVKILKRLNIPITREMGECLMSGIITDTGGFRYDTVDDETFEFAAQMLDLGVNISDIYYKTFDYQTRARFDLMTIAVTRLKFYDDKIAVTYLKKSDFEKAKAKIGEHEGIVNVGRNVEGVKVSVFLREDSDDTYHVSLRSNNFINVSEIAEFFEGGGHADAAGFTIVGELDKVIKTIVKEINSRL